MLEDLDTLLAHQESDVLTLREAAGLSGYSSEHLEAIKKLWHWVLAPLATVLEYGFGRQAARLIEAVAVR